MTHRFKKFILFDMPCYYPSGGLNDIAGSFDTLQEAVADAEAKIESNIVVKSTGKRVQYDKHENPEIIDRDTWERVWPPR